MTQTKLTDAISSNDSETKLWKARFSSAKAAFAMSEFRQCESLLFRAMEQAKSLKESIFAINTCHVGLGALYLATDKIPKAEEHLDTAIRSLEGCSEDSLKELLAVALKFHADLLLQKGELKLAEDDLTRAMKILEEIGPEGAVQLAYVSSELAVLYIKQNQLTEAKELLFSSMEILETVFGPENPEYIRANIIFNVARSDDDELLEHIEDGIFQLQYQRGQKHPSIMRALKWYLKKLHDDGEEEKIIATKQRFGLSSQKKIF